MPAAVSVVDVSKLVQVRRGLSLDESLREIPGIAVGNRRNEAQGDRLIVRGAGARAQFGVRGVKLLLDGVPLTMADGQSVLYNLDPGTVGLVEAIRGPSSVRYGNAGGGVLSFDTRFGGGPGWRIEPVVQIGSFGYRRIRVGAETPLGGLRTRVDLGTVETDGWREYSAFKTRRAGVVLRGVAGASTHLFATVNVHHMPWAENSGSLTEEAARTAPRSVRPLLITQGTGKSSTQGQLGAGVEQVLGRAVLAASVWGLTRDLWNAIPTRIISLDRSAGGVRTAVSGGGEGPFWLLGLDVEALSDSRREYENEGVPEGGDRAKEGRLLLDQRETVLAAAPFVDLQVPLTSVLRATVSARWDNYRFRAVDRLLEDGDDSGERTFRELSPAAGVSWSPISSVSAYASYSTGFITPTTSELSNQPDGSGGFNLDLLPERLRSLELGLRGRLGLATFRYNVAVYTSRVDDALVPEQGPDEEVFFSNSGEVSRKGLEVGAMWTPHPSWTTRLSAVAQRNRFVEFRVGDEDFAGRTEPGSPTTWVLLGLAWRPARAPWLEAEFRWIDDYPVNNRNTAFNSPSTVLDLKAGFNFVLGSTEFQIYAGVDNVTGERYNGSVVPNAFGQRYFEPAPGTEVYAGLAIGILP